MGIGFYIESSAQSIHSGMSQSLHLPRKCLDGIFYGHISVNVKVIKEGKLPVRFRVTDLPVLAGVITGEAAGDKVLFNGDAVQHLSAAGDKILCSFQYDPHFLQMFKSKAAVPPCLDDPAGGLDTDAGNPEKLRVACVLNLDRELFQMPEGPVTFWIDHNIKIRTFFAQKLSGMETVISEKPVCLIQPVFSQKGRGGMNIRQCRILIERNIGGEENPLQIVLLIEPLGDRQKFQISLTGRADDHLSALTGRDERRGAVRGCE